MLLLQFTLLLLLCAVALGWFAGQRGWLAPGANLGKADSSQGDQAGPDPSRVLSNAAFFIFIPALLFRTTARIDVAGLPWATLAAFFVPVMAVLLGVYAWQQWRPSAAKQLDGQPLKPNDAARPSVRASCAV